MIDQFDIFSDFKRPFKCFNIFVIFFFLKPSYGFAQTGFNSSGVNGGSVRVGEDLRACDSSLAGAMRYDTGSSSIQICKNNAPTEPSGCNSVGDVCSDGTLYAFSRNYGSGNEKVYVTDTNQSAATQWKTTTGVDDISVDSNTDGKSNVSSLNSAVSNFPAINLCASLNLHSATDWYLPAVDELNDLYSNKVAIEANASEAFVATGYWTSTENNTTTAIRQNLGNGSTGTPAKDQLRDVRCIRRGPTNPGGYAWTTWGQ